MALRPSLGIYQYAEDGQKGVTVNNQELALIEPGERAVAELGVSRPPEIVLEEARRAATALHDVISSKPKPVKYNGEIYLELEDWLTVARFYGLTVRTRSTQYVEYGGARGWEAVADVWSIATEQVMSTAEAMCLNDEANWSRKPMFQLRSMAQTRACAKALRNVLSWVVVLAGYRGTPAEEMPVKTQPKEDWSRNAQANRVEQVKVPQTELQQLQATMVDRDSVGRALQGLVNLLAARDGEDAAYEHFSKILDGYGVPEWQNLKNLGEARAVCRELWDLLHQEPLPFVEIESEIPF